MPTPWSGDGYAGQYLDPKPATGWLRRKVYHCDPCQVGWQNNESCWCCGARGTEGPALMPRIETP